MIGRRLAAAVLAAATIVAASAGEASTRYDPRLRFRTLSTPRFDIHFHQGEEADARRLAILAEEVATTLDGSLGPATGRVQVVLVNQDDLPNGWAIPVPYNLIEIRTVTPGGSLSIGHTDDWLRLVFTHEYTHVVHLSRGGGWVGGLRRVFGRHPLLFPNLALPAWQIEGLAVYEESTLTGAGRLPAGDFRAVLTTASGAGRFEPLDRVSGGLDDWPRGQGPYVYGGYFQQFLAERYGAPALRRLTDRTASLPPYLGSLAYRSVFGQSLGALWKDFAASQVAPATVSAATRLTSHGFAAEAPRFGPDGAVYYSVVDPHGFPALRRLDLPGGASTRIADRYLGDGLAFAGRTIVFDQAEVHAEVGLQFDLFAHALDSGRTTRLTSGARAADPDLFPDGRIVCTVQRVDRRDLVIYPFDPLTRALGSPRIVATAEGQAFSAPRVSPDGRLIAVERRLPGRMPEVVTVDPADGTIRQIATDPRRRFTSPAWLPDGRTLLMAADLDDGDFGLVAADLDSGALRRLENAGPAARAPEVSADGKTLIYVGLTDAGDDLFLLPLAEARWSALLAMPTTVSPPPGRLAAASAEASRPYSQWRTLAPRFWTPTLESDAGETVAGAATAMTDALGRHTFGVEAGWAAARARPDWQVAYAYDRWWPTAFAAYSDDTDPLDNGTIRTRELSAGLLFPLRRVRLTQSLLAGVYYGNDEVDRAPGTDAADSRRRRGAIRFGYSANTSRLYGYSISREDGTSLAATSEFTRTGLGADGNAGAAVLDLRRYQGLWPRHGVLALRAAAAGSWGDAAIRRRFRATGEDAQPGGLRFGTDAIGLVRGFDAEVPGTRAAVINVDYRLPLLRIQRGLGTWPFFARTLHAAVFADAGYAWDADPHAADARRSLGAELSLDAVVGYALPLTFTAGTAWRQGGGADRADREVVAFARIGRAF